VRNGTKIPLSPVGLRGEGGRSSPRRVPRARSRQEESIRWRRQTQNELACCPAFKVYGLTQRNMRSNLEGQQRARTRGEGLDPGLLAPRLCVAVVDDELPAAAETFVQRPNRCVWCGLEGAVDEQELREGEKRQSVMRVSHEKEKHKEMSGFLERPHQRVLIRHREALSKKFCEEKVERSAEPTNAAGGDMRRKWGPRKTQLNATLQHHDRPLRAQPELLLL
jgi:hypothetical protein